MEMNQIVLLGDGPGRAARVTLCQDEVRVRVEYREEGGREVVVEVTPPTDLRDRLAAVLLEIQRRAFPKAVPVTF